jgi:hypothetical protein
MRGARLQSLWTDRSVHMVVVFLCAGTVRESVSMGTSLAAGGCARGQRSEGQGGSRARGGVGNRLLVRESRRG